jgi:hypothetical protein
LACVVFPDLVVVVLGGRVFLHPLLLYAEAHFDVVAGAGTEAWVCLLHHVAFACLHALSEAEVSQSVQGAEYVLFLLLTPIEVHPVYKLAY